MICVEGKYGIYAKILKDSISPRGVRLTTFEVQYWRGILAELNTHRMLSRNSASSRAIPFAKMQRQLTGRPVRFGQANPGMQDKGVDYKEDVIDPDNGISTYPPDIAWEFAKEDAIGWSQAFNKAGYHKQVYNRLTEPFQMVKSVISATEYNNFFWLRDDDAADPSIRELARVMREAREQSVPTLLHEGEWHVPYVETSRNDDDVLCYVLRLTDESDGVQGSMFISAQDAVKVSAARCAAVSFRNVDYGLEKCFEVHQRLVGDDRKHASALEHQATPLYSPWNRELWEKGVSHQTKDGALWSGNFREWIQYRKTIDGENVPG